MKSNKRKNIIIIITIFTILFTVLGGSLAYWMWITDVNQHTNVAFSIDANFSCSADGGEDINSKQELLMPTSKCTDSDYAIQRTITVMPDIKNDDISVSMNVWLKINSIDEGLLNSDNFMYALTTNPSSCTEGVISSGSFKGRDTGNIVPLITGNEYTTTTQEKYYLYIWLDSSEENNDTQNNNFDLSLGGECSDIPNEPEAPVLDEGMIPVTILNDGTVRTVSEDDSSWYDYDNKEWANVVLVSDTNRQTYLDNLSSNMEVAEEDILAYYVWIPRYKYKVWTNSTTILNSPQTIDVVFEAKDDPYTVNNTSFGGGDTSYEDISIDEEITVNTYYTHPAFWWDNDNDKLLDYGELKAGIWVGKFETSTDKTSECYVNSYNSAVTEEERKEICNNTEQSVRILPNVYPLRFQNISVQFQTSRNVASTDNEFGLTSEGIDSHMAKNSEWGAVAYLSHSIYGINDEVRINNVSKYTTGCGASEVNGAATSSCQIKYGNATSYPQSTTGNITGIFDMSGGAREYVMGNYDGYLGKSDFTELPESKYYDQYKATCTLEECGGHSLFETTGWYDDLNNFFGVNGSWLRRGGRWDDGETAGIFHSHHSDGKEYRYAWRSVLVNS